MFKKIKVNFNHIKIMLNTEISKKLIGNSSWLVSDKIITIFIGLYSTSLVSKYFGPQILGQMNYVISITSLFISVSSLGLETLMIKELVEKKRNEGEVLYSGFVLRIIVSTLIVLVCMLIIYVLEPNQSMFHILTFIYSFNILIRSFEVLEYWVQANHLAKNISFLKIIVYLTTFIAKLLLIYFKGNIIHYSIIITLESTFYGMLLFLYYLKAKDLNSTARFNANFSKNILSKSWHLIVASLLVTIYMKTDQIMLGRMLTTKFELGLYSAADYIATLWYFVPMAIIISFKPIILKYRHEDEIKYTRYLKILYLIIFSIGMLASVSIIFLSKLIILIIFGNEYIGAIRILSISIWSGTIAMLGVAASIWYISEGMQKYNTVFVLIGAIINIILNFILIPKYGGVGAAIATLITQIIVNLIVPYFCRDTKKNIVLILDALRFRI